MITLIVAGLVVLWLLMVLGLLFDIRSAARRSATTQALILDTLTAMLTNQEEHHHG